MTGNLKQLPLPFYRNMIGSGSSHSVSKRAGLTHWLYRTLGQKDSASFWMELGWTARSLQDLSVVPSLPSTVYDAPRGICLEGLKSLVAGIAHHSKPSPSDKPHIIAELDASLERKSAATTPEISDRLARACQERRKSIPHE